MATSRSWSWRSGGGGGLTNIGKQAVAVTTQIWNSASSLTSKPSTDLRRYNNETWVEVDYVDKVYEKNPDDQAPLQVVLDELIQPESEEYWAPHPQTGVFGPPNTQLISSDQDQELDHAAAADINMNHGGGGETTVLDQTAFFRPTSIEDLEKPIDLLVDQPDAVAEQQKKHQVS